MRTWTTNAQAYRARCLPYDEIVAVKLVDLESGTVNLVRCERKEEIEHGKRKDA